MTELEIMQRAKQYIDALANGIDPLSGRPVREDDVVNQVRISRCLFYVSGVLQKVIDNGGAIRHKRIPRRQRAPFEISAEQAAALKTNAAPVSASKIVSALNSLIDEETMQKLKVTELIAWLRTAGLLQTVETPDGKKHTVPTPDGERLGIRETTFLSEQGVQTRYAVYDRNAQQFIFDNLAAVIAFLRSTDSD